jgi:hypothetical protein
MNVILQAGPCGNYLTTIAIGEKYFNDWQMSALPMWKSYCERHELGLIVVTEDLISRTDKLWKKATWQKMLLGEALAKLNLDILNVCYLDSDILISPFAENIFNRYDTKTIGLVSQIKNLPQQLDLTQRRLAYLRHYRYDSHYPLDSALFMSPQEIFEFHGVRQFDNYACMGLIVFNVKNHSSLMRGWFNNYDQNITSLTGGGDEPLINYEIQNWGKITWLPYEYQALWNYEIVWKYPFLYDYGRNNEDLIRECIESSLYVNHFLHFAGSWYESDMWKIGNFFKAKHKQDDVQNFTTYKNSSLSRLPKGQIKPPIKIS